MQKVIEFYQSCLLQTWGLFGFPAFRIWMHSPPLHISHPSLRQGVNSIGISL